jgi:hypothetical protein
MASSSISAKERAWTTFLWRRDWISPFSNFRSSSTARFRWGVPRTSARNSSEKIEMSGFLSPAAAMMSTTPSDATARETICRTAKSSTSSGFASPGARFARTTRIEAELVSVAAPLPAYRLLLTIPGIGPTVGAILLAKIGDIAWYTKFSQLRKLTGLDIVRVQSGQFARQARISKCGRSLLRWALYHAAMGMAQTVAGRARLAALKAKRAGDRFAGLKATVELAAKVLRIVWGVWRSGQPYDPLRAGGLRRQPR